MRLFRRQPNFDFMGRRRTAVLISIVAVIVSIVSLATRGLELGLDFTGGVLIVVRYDEPANLESIRGLLQTEGYGQAVVQNFGTATDVQIRLPPAGTDPAEGSSDEIEAVSNFADRVVALLRTADNSVERLAADTVSTQIGEELVENGGRAMLFVLVIVFLYIVLRFRWKFAAGANAALVHDVIITFGFFSLVGLEFNQSVLAAVLAMIGYSLNDTIVVYDRIRENFRLMRRGTAEAIINTSINQTLSRTIVTGITTLLVLTALYVLGGETVKGFSLALIVGIVVGTYSSIYVASAAALFLDVSPMDLIPPKREEIDSMP
ncbi:MAG TPA: protein translocase subunit SecF [Gammaproteobacteria bacterium]|nr:protein translocase subunit SecF [Gammaproteobacteria bacterium]